MASKQDSNATGLRFAEETDIGEVDPGATWHALEPNTYNDFGGQIATVARNPINQTRQRKKGTVTDLDASGGFNQDFTQANMTRLLQGFCFASMREKADTVPLNGSAVVITGVDGALENYEAASGLGVFKAGDIILASGFGVTANNGIKTVSAAAAGTLTVDEDLTSEAAPPAAARLQAVGFQFPTGDVDIVMNGGLAQLVASVTDLTTLGLIPGEWVFLGGDAAVNTFENNQGFARVSTISVDTIEFDKVQWSPQAESGAAKDIRVFVGKCLRNEDDPANIVRRTYNLERTLGSDDNGVMSEYLEGSVPNEMTVNLAQADKVTVDLGFVSVDHTTRDGTTGVKPGSRPALSADDAYNTSSDIARLKLAAVSDDDAAPEALFAFATQMTLNINNNVSPNKALGVLGAFDISAGTFEVGGEMTVYFADVAAIEAVKANADITLDVALVKNNAGLVFDVPLLSLGNGRLDVQQDQPITLPLETSAAESRFGHTLLITTFGYLPSAA